MEKSPVPGDTLFMGVDGGGTKCRAVLVDGQKNVIGLGEGGACNAYQSFDKAIDSILVASEKALMEAGLKAGDRDKVVVGMGLAGVNIPDVYTRVWNWQHPFKARFLMTDLHAACVAAHGGSEGAVIVAGTGSCGFAQAGDRVLKLGAHGFPFGDKGSGAWIGLQALQAVLLNFDDLGKPTMLTELIATALKADGLDIIERMHNARTGDYASLAPAVFTAAEAGDPVAIAILREGADYLSDLADRLWSINPPRMSMLGGISHKMKDWMRNDIIERMSPALQQPEHGALFYAMQEYAQSIA